MLTRDTNPDAPLDPGNGARAKSVQAGLPPGSDSLEAEHTSNFMPGEANRIGSLVVQTLALSGSG